MLGKQRLVKVLSAVVVSLLSGGAAWGVTASTASSHASSESTEVDSSTSSSVEVTSSTDASTTTTEDSTTTTEASTTTTAETTPTPLAPTTPVTGECNHGADVSRVAHEAPRGDGNEHGKAVSAAAHQKCEKTDASDAGAETDAGEEADAPEAHDDASEKHAPESGGEHGS